MKITKFIIKYFCYTKIKNLNIVIFFYNYI